MLLNVINNVNVKEKKRKCEENHFSLSKNNSFGFKMALSNVLLLSQIAGYVIALILSLCIIVPMSLHQDEFRLDFTSIICDY